MDTPITRAEHEEFRRRIEEENKRQDKRIEILEENAKRIEGLNSSIEKLALNMENMLKETPFRLPLQQRLSSCKQKTKCFQHSSKRLLIGKTSLRTVLLKWRCRFTAYDYRY